MKPRYGFLLATALCALTIGLTTVGAAQKGGGKPPPPPPPDKIAFMRNVGGGANYQIFTMRSDGSQATQLTSGADGSTSWMPGWLPDGRIAFGKGSAAGTGEVWVMNHDGTGARRIAVAPNCPLHGEGSSMAADLAVSPDGSFVAFGNNDGPDVVCVVRSDGGGPPVEVAHHENLSDTVWPNNWSPDLDPLLPGYQGMLLYGTQVQPGSVMNLYAVQVSDDGNGNPVLGQVQLALPGARKAWWSPDGRRLALLGLGGWSGSDINLIDVPWADGVPQFPVNFADAYPVSPAGAGNFRCIGWKPTSDHLVVSMGRWRNPPYYEHPDIYKLQVPPDRYGARYGLVQLTNYRQYESLGSWSLPLWP